MNRIFFLLFSVTLLGTVYVIVPVMSDTYRRYRGRKTVICPETGQIAEVDLKATQASVFSAIGKQRVGISWCSLWPRKKGCAEECVENIGGRHFQSSAFR